MAIPLFLLKQLTIQNSFKSAKPDLKALRKQA